MNTRWQRSDEAKAWRHLYKRVGWRDLRQHRLHDEPLCRFCLAIGITRAATVVDHIEPHKGRTYLFFDYENTQSLCAPCHDAAKQRIEIGGYDSAAGLDGMPTDPYHPANRKRRGLSQSHADNPSKA